MVFITILELIVFGLLTTLLKYWTGYIKLIRPQELKKFDSYDFATLYANFPHNALKNNIRSLVREAIKIRGAKYIIVDRHDNGHWSLESTLSTACVKACLHWTRYLDRIRINPLSLRPHCTLIVPNQIRSGSISIHFRR